jgi:hypothetical protein
MLGSAAALALSVMSTGEAAVGSLPAPRIVRIVARDGTALAAAVYLPAVRGRFPTLFAASPYRFDNDAAPAMPVFLWNETGPIAWYLEHGYAYVHMDVRGSGRSGGDFSYFGRKEQTDLYDAIEWIAEQPWSNGNVGGVGQSYYARSQWIMGIENPPHLKCIAPYDGDVDTYRFSAYSGGILGDYPAIWYSSAPRYNNLYPATGPSRRLTLDYPELVNEHPLYDDFWKERSAIDRLGRIRVPVYSIGVWSKMNFALNGNIWGYELVRSPKKLLVVGTGSVAGAVANFSSIAFHERFMLPFYDHYLKGASTTYQTEPAARYFLDGADQFESADAWPPRDAVLTPYFLAPGPSGSVVSLNDGALDAGAPAGNGLQTSYDYPDPGWRIGVVGDGPNGRPDPVRRVLTFTTAPLPADVKVVGPIQLDLYASSSRRDTNFVVKLSDQVGDANGTGDSAINPESRIVSKGWLRAALRHVDPAKSLPNAPYYTFDREQPLIPGQIEHFVIALTPSAHIFRRGHRIRLEIVNGDSAITDIVWTHTYGPRLVGRDTIYHDAAHPSKLSLPILS